MRTWTWSGDVVMSHDFTILCESEIDDTEVLNFKDTFRYNSHIIHYYIISILIY